LGPGRLDKLHAAVIAILPLVLLGVATYFRHVLDHSVGDPDYQYLLNGLNILQFRGPGQIDHPGTPVQLLAGLISGVVWLARVPFGAGPSPADDVFRQPELYLGIIRLVFDLFSSAALFALGWRIFSYSGSVVAAITAQVSIFFSYPALTFGLTQVSPEGLLLPLTLTLAAAMVPAAFASDTTDLARTAALVGVLIGACLATKTNALPLIFCFYIFERKIGELAVKWAVFSLVVLTLPVIGKYGAIITFNWRMLTHVGKWGTGESRVIDPVQYWTALKQMYFDVPEIYISFALCLILALLTATKIMRTEKFTLTRLLVVSAAVEFAQIALVAKYGQGHYLVPVSATVCLANAGICLVLLRGGMVRRVTAVVAVLALVCLGLTHGAPIALNWVYVNAVERRDNSAVLERFSAPGCKLIHAYESQTIPFKLRFGITTSGLFHLPALYRAYPEALFYQERDRAIETATGLIRKPDIDAWVRQNCVYLVSSTLERFTPDFFGILPDHLAQIDRSPHGVSSVAIYRIVPAAAGQSIFID
jgi:hypothetical protein